MTPELSRRLGRVWSEIPEHTHTITYTELSKYLPEIENAKNFDELPDKLKELVIATEEKLKLKFNL